MKRAYVVLPIFIALVLCAGANALSSQAESAIDDFMALRMELTCEDDIAVILDKIEDFKRSIKSKPFDEEESLVLENFIEMEKYNYLKDGSDGIRQSLKEAFKKLRQRNADFLERAGDRASKWLLCTAGDVTSCYISFSMADVIKYGLGIKKLYQKAISDAGDAFSYGRTNIAQWYYWAPKINGGSKAKAAEYFERAVKEARNKAEEFYAQTFWSQWLFESGDNEGALSALNLAENICPKSNRIKEMKSANALGMSFFEWDKKRSKMVK